MAGYVEAAVVMGLWIAVQVGGNARELSAVVVTFSMSSLLISAVVLAGPNHSLFTPHFKIAFTRSVVKLFITPGKKEKKRKNKTRAHLQLDVFNGEIEHV